LNLFQIWIFPKQKKVEPRYAQRKYELNEGTFTELVGPQESGISTWIHQDAWLSMGTFKAGRSQEYQLKRQGNGIYLMLVEGQIKIGDQLLTQRDAIGISQTNQVQIEIEANAKILVIEVPMN
jgi:redox-sensitive bicupin YhaK (pirin superfamily)